MTAEAKKDLVQLIEDVFSVLERADIETSILSLDFPSNFYEADSTKIIDSLRNFFDESGDSGSTTTILKKNDSKEYTNLYDIYHDIKVASSLKIRNLKIGSKDYKAIDFFYKFSTEILLRESSLLKTALFSYSSENDTPSELEEQVASDFEKIGHSYSVSNGEVATYMSEMPNPSASSLIPSFGYATSSAPPTIKQPLFTSQLGKSELDPRFTLIPEPYNLVKSIPLPKNVGSSSATFETLNAHVSKIPLPTNKPTTVLDNFLYITWYIIKAPEWLTYTGKTLKPTITSNLFKDANKNEFRLANSNNESVKSFAPKFDSKGTGVSEILKNNVWLNQIGYKKIDEIRKEYLKNTGKEIVTDQNKEESDSKSSLKVETKEAVDDDENVYFEDYDESKTIEIEKVLKWDPTEIDVLKSLKKDNKQITGSAKHLQQLISKELLKLNKLRQERFLRSNFNNVLPATLAEKKLYKKITKLISLSINLHKVAPSDLPLEFSKRVPVLMTDYSGTLPSLPASKSRSTRLPNIRGPYKKKPR